MTESTFCSRRLKGDKGKNEKSSQEKLGKLIVMDLFNIQCVTVNIELQKKYQ